MGVLDAFTASSAKKAAAENMARLAALKTEGMGFLDTGKTGALGSIDAAKGYYDPIATKYGAGTDLYLDSLGVNGTDGNARATGAFQTGPGYQWKVDQSLDALDRRAASRGLLASGNNTLDTLDTVHGIAGQEYGSWQDRLAGLINPEMTATGGLASLEAGKAPIYVNDANSRVGLASGVTSGMNNQATQRANAEMAASGNVIKAGMGLASLAAGGLGGIGATGASGVGSLLSSGGSNPFMPDGSRNTMAYGWG